jgi:carboxyl-terminal processing protease
LLLFTFTIVPVTTFYDDSGAQNKSCKAADRKEKRKMDNWSTNQQNYQITEPPQKTKSKFGWGILAGVLGTVLIAGVSLQLFCRANGIQIYLMRNAAAGGSGSTVSVDLTGSSLLDESTTDKLNELSTYIKYYYYDDVDEQDLRDGMYAGLLEGVGDKYSVYYNEQEYESLQIDTTGQYYGIGAGLSQNADTMAVTIIKIYEGTPSEAAGLKKDDVILSVDDTQADSMELSNLVKLIRGDAGTTVHLEVYRPSTEEYLSFDVERADVTLPSVESEMLENHIGYILIDSFETDTANQFEKALAALEADGMEALIVDVRSNPGGMVTSVVQILDDILPEGLLVYIEDKYGNRQEYSSDGATSLDCPIAVLINGDSASASEIFAGAIKDYEYGTLIGTTTFGKGIVQTIFPLEDGDAVKITTAKYFTPKGNYIHGVGIDPDIELEYEYLDPDGESYEKQYDNQLQKAIEVLTEEMGQ